MKEKIRYVEPVITTDLVKKLMRSFNQDVENIQKTGP
jgi:hypothetical protein